MGRPPPVRYAIYQILKQINSEDRYYWSSLLLSYQYKDNEKSIKFQAISRKEENSSSDASNLSKDIRIENFDLSFGDKVTWFFYESRCLVFKRWLFFYLNVQVLLSGAGMSLIYGRRYGLIGRNGLGKSTLLRTLSKRQLVIPKHISILHVEQEVIGDDTQALQSVLVNTIFWGKYFWVDLYWNCRLKYSRKAIQNANHCYAKRKISTQNYQKGKFFL